LTAQDAFIKLSPGSLECCRNHDLAPGRPQGPSETKIAPNRLYIAATPIYIIKL